MPFDLKTSTIIHVAIRLLAIASGFVVVFGLIAGRRLNLWTAFFLATTIATSVTGFGFPIHGVTPGIVLGVVSLVVLAIALYARYVGQLAGAWRPVYVITAVIALYLNFFVLIVQSFQKVSALKAMAPTQSECALRGRATRRAGGLHRPGSPRDEGIPSTAGPRRLTGTLRLSGKAPRAPEES